MMASTYLFYDIESSGLSRTFDQVMQFAAIRTDLNLRPIEEINLYATLSPDTIPAPEAVVTHRITPNKLVGKDNEMTVIRTIHRLLNTEGTISCGYNNLRFDDKLLRFSFYRHLLEPYTHQYANCCYRIDLYPMMLMYHLYHPDVLQWPMKDGKPCFRLEALARENQIETGSAHDALHDVKATLALARRLQAKRAMWDYLIGHFQKKHDLSRIQSLPQPIPSYHLGVLVSPHFGAACHYQCPALRLGQHQHYRNQTLWLRLDQVLNVNHIEDAPDTCIVRKKAGEPPFVLPPKPRFIQQLPPSVQKCLQEHLAQLAKNETGLSHMTRCHTEAMYPKTPNLDVDAALYEAPFPSPEDQQQCHRFHTQQSRPGSRASDWVACIEAIKEPKLKARAIRCVGRFYCDQLPPAWQQSFAQHLATLTQKDAQATRPVNHQGESRRTRQEALHDVQRLRETGALNAAQKRVLDAWERMCYNSNSTS